jgi:pterin-4a-carbinolamine dehydratase
MKSNTVKWQKQYYIIHHPRIKNSYGNILVHVIINTHSNELCYFCGTLTITTENVNKMQVRSLQEEYIQVDL